MKEIFQLQKPHGISEVRVHACTFNTIQEFHTYYSTVLHSYNWKVQLIINVDESWTNKHKLNTKNKVLSIRGESGDGILSIPDMEEHISIVGGICASGDYLLPHFLLRVKTYSNQLAFDRRSFPYHGYSIAYSKRGWQSKVRYNPIFKLN